MKTIAKLIVPALFANLAGCETLLGSDGMPVVPQKDSAIEGSEADAVVASPPSGSLDETFGTGGVYSWVSNLTWPGVVRGLAIDSSGNILFSGFAYCSG